MVFNPLFQKRSEGLFLAFPAIAFFCVVQLTYGATDPHSLKSSLSFFIDIFFLGTAHTVLTFWILLQNRGAQNWIRETSRREQRGFWKHIVIIGALLTLFLSISHKIIPVPTGVFITISSILTLFIAVLVPLHHSLFQIQGISLLYGSRLINIDQTQSNRIADIKRREKFFFQTFYFILITPFLLRYLTEFEILSISKPDLISISLVATAILSLIFLAIIANQTLTRSWDINRFLFSLRLILFAMLPIYEFSYLALAGIHGVEYAFLSRKIMGKDDIYTHRFISIASLLFLLALAFLLRTGRHISTSSHDAHILIGILAVFAYVVQYLHVHIDSKLFKMNSPESREFAQRLVGQ